ncbi:Rha family transcriptional regulator [Pseudomonas sp. Marseille-P9899]|uniref:Rha family transcriptional regulator n=1 Tax=Pseudomonas sp. Marseille-P9899 TaxID=2730401 RepID=UPI00158ED22F|nr:Rha family transcriptional regulator [Pseudomonas sp. Marseille-P9899]
MSKTETISTKTISTREFAAIVGHSHGNICRILEGMLKRGELNLRVSQYRNKPGGKKFDEYHLKLTDATLLNGRLGEKYQRAWAEYVQSQRPVGEVEEAPKPIVFNVANISVSHPVSAGVTRIVSPAADELTMSSREIATLTGKRHDNVMSDIRKMITDLGLNAPDFSGAYKTDRGNTYECFDLPRREVDILLTGYSTTMRAAVIDRWRELEAEAAKPVHKVPTSFLDAMKLATELEEKRLQLSHQVEVQAVKIQEDAPKVEVYHKIADSTGLIGFQKFCTQLNLKQSEVKHWMREIGWLRAHQYAVNPLPTATAVDSGYCKIRNFTTDGGKLVQRIWFTGKAVTYASEKAPSYVRKLEKKADK